MIVATKIRLGGWKMTTSEMYALLTEENKEKIILLIEKIKAEQSLSPQEPCSQD